MLSTADVEQKTFSTALRGYDLDEVDDFLDEIVATIRELSEQLEEARAAAEGAPTPVTQATEMPSPPADEAVPAEAPVEPPPADTAKPDIDESAI
ncbi:MAG TPA: DivIVA domain-containing protein, partial [Acidimicrobiia bacterium]|nr:DivIVA domain-containing protein [Acidimicrobiia bacterium]